MLPPSSLFCRRQRQGILRFASERAERKSYGCRLAVENPSSNHDANDYLHACNVNDLLLAK